MAGLPTVRRPGLVAAAVVGLLVVLGITSLTWTRPDRRTLPPPSSTSSTEAVPAETTEPVDLSRIAHPPVAGETTTTLRERGRAVVQGTVSGPDGAVPEAVVVVERVVGDAAQRREVRAGADGSFVVDGLPGGRMRVRAYLPPQLTMATPAVFFLADGETRDLRLDVTLHTGPDVRAATAPTSPVAGELVNLLIWVAEKVVDDAGVARTVPRAGVPVDVRSTGWTPVQERPTTDGEGVALFTYRCERPTSVTATAVVGTEPDSRSYPLEVPACAPRPTTTTTAPTTTTTTEDDGG